MYVWLVMFVKFEVCIRFASLKVTFPIGGWGIQWSATATTSPFIRQTYVYILKIYSSISDTPNDISSLVPKSHKQLCESF